MLGSWWDRRPQTEQGENGQEQNKEGHVFPQGHVVKWSESHSVVSDSLQPHGLFASPWNALAQNIPNAGIRARTPALQADSLPAEPQGKPRPRGVSDKTTPLCVFTLPSSSYLPSSPSCSFLLFSILFFFLPLPANRRNKTYHQMTEKRHQSVSSVAPKKTKQQIVVSDSLWSHGLQHTRLPCPSPTPWAFSNLCPSSQWCYPIISSSVVPFSSHLQSFPASGSFPMNRFFTSGGQSIGVSASASVLPMNIQDWFPLGWTGWIFWQSRGLPRVFTNTTVQKHQFFSAQLCL